MEIDRFWVSQVRGCETFESAFPVASLAVIEWFDWASEEASSSTESGRGPTGSCTVKAGLAGVEDWIVVVWSAVLSGLLFFLIFCFKTALPFLSLALAFLPLTPMLDRIMGAQVLCFLIWKIDVFPMRSLYPKRKR